MLQTLQFLLRTKLRPRMISYSVLGLAQQKSTRNGILIYVKNLHAIFPANDMQNKLQLISATDILSI